MKNKAKTASLSDEFDNLLVDIEHLLRTTRDLTGDELNEMRDKLHARVAEAKDSVNEFSSVLSRKAHESATEIDREVHEEPWKAIGVSAAVGLLLGLVISRR